MLLRRFSDFILRDSLRAIGVALICTFIPLIGTLSVLIAGLVTLRKGAIQGALVFLAATLPLLLMYTTSSKHMDEMAMIVLGVILVSNVLTWILAVMLRHYSNWNMTLEYSAFVALAAIIAIHVCYPNIQLWWETQLHHFLDKVVAALPATQDTDIAPKEISAQLVAMGKRYANGFVFAAVLGNAWLQLILARWWQAILFNPGGLRAELSQIRLSRLLGIIFVVLLALAAWGNTVAFDCMPVLYVTFFAAGLSLLHSGIAMLRASWIWLLLMYAGIIWLFPMSIVGIAFIALIDTGIDIRKQLNRFILKG